ncbi:MAG TPA: alpha/beta hydrolase [Chitinophagaceae bacterium]|nr:alpha/beta hydrolase [Chitinophagaceae bacterium]
MEIPASREVRIPVGREALPGSLTIPEDCHAVVLFSHGSGSSRFSSRNQQVARYLNHLQIGTLLFDLLTPEEDRSYQNRFNIGLLTQRLTGATRWLLGQVEAGSCRMGYFGASTGAASALGAAAQIPAVRAVVSRGGRPDLAMEVLPQVTAPTLLIVGSLDFEVLELNRKAYERLQCEKKLEVIPGATHLFEEAGKMTEVAFLAGTWFQHHLQLQTSSFP